MDKQSFISEIKPILKGLGYRKNGNYWYKSRDSHICCINVQGSQWDKDDYYINIGFAYPPLKNPTLMHWHCIHRCRGASGDVNILPEELLSKMAEVFDAVLETSQIPVFLKKRNTVKIGSWISF